jgi:hypothetical protein
MSPASDASLLVPVVWWRVQVQVLACDKTGTLTEGRLQVTGRHTLEGAMLDSQVTS